MLRDNRHDSASIFGATCPARAAIIAPAANTECMSLHLQEISTQVTPGSLTKKFQASAQASTIAS